MAVLDTLDTLAPIREKVEAGERLDFEDGVTLMETDDLLALGELADLARRVRGGGDEVFFVQNLYLNQTNVCRVKCKFCAFAKTQKQEDAYTMTRRRARRGRGRAARGREASPRSTASTARTRTSTSSSTPTSCASCKAALPDVHLKFYTASEIHHMSKLEGCTHDEVLRVLKDAGLGSLPGGGAEIFAPRVRAADRARQGAGRGVVPRARHRAPAWASRRTARCSTATSRPTRSASTTCCACASSRTRPAASSRSSRSRSIPRTRCSSGAASSSRPAPTT